MNIFIACDGQYYDRWAENCLKSIKFYVPWIKLTAHIVNPISHNEIDGVIYYYESREFANDSSKIGYYQAVRFLKCVDYFPNNELVMTIDSDTVLMKSFTEKEFKEICNKVSVQRHQKDIRWMAGLVTFGRNNFKHRFKEELLKKSIDEWSHGWDQDVLEILSHEFNYNKIMVGDWMSFGRGGGIFLTLKGDQKNSPGYLENYIQGLKLIQN